MTTPRPAVERLPRKVLPLAAAALLIASLPVFAGQELSRPDDSSDVGRTAYEVGSRTFEPASEPSTPSAPEPSEPSTPSAPSEPSVSSEPSTPSEEPSPEPTLVAQTRTPPTDSSDTGRTAHDSGSHGSSSSSSSTPSSSGSSNGGWSSSSSSRDSGRTARPVGPGDSEPHRQPPSRSDRGHHGGGGHYGGGYYYPYGYFGPYGYWPGFSWWWGWWYDPYDYYPYRYGYGQPGYYGRGGDLGALDLDVYPARTEVYLDGEYIGKVDAFDGWPRYLWLPKGTYDLVLYLDGFKTVARQITVYPGSVIDIDDRLEPGESVRPENLASKSHERRDERLRYERERRDRIERGERGDDDEDWRDRVHRERGEARGEDRDDDQDIDVQEESHGKGRLRLDVEPEDASVYLDGRFVGTGTELGLMRGGLPVAPGEHKLAVVRPGRKAEEREFRVEPGEEVELEVDLEADGR